MKPSSWLTENSDLDRLKGIAPRLWVCVGPEWSREELKRRLFRKGFGFSSKAFTDLESLCAQILHLRPERVLSPLARKEGLRLLLSERTLSRRLPELRRLKRQRGFLKKLDRALQSGRMTYGHASEREVLEARLEEEWGENPVRAELAFFGAVFEAWLEQGDYWDLPRLLSAATARLSEEWPREIGRPEEIRFLTAQRPEARWIGFAESIERAGVRVSWPMEGTETGREEERVDALPSWTWELWHTVDDASSALVAEMSRAFEKRDWDQTRDVILIPDDASVKRSLKRALAEAGLPLADPRDNLALKQSEWIKIGFLPLQVVASRFEREKVVSWIRGFHRDPERVLQWIPEIYSRGVRDGLDSYQGGKLAELHRILEGLDRSLSGKMKLENLAEAHLKLLNGASFLPQDPFFPQFWNTWLEESQLLGEGARSAPLLYWWERLRDRLEGSSLSPDRARPEKGVEVYRLSQGNPFPEGQGARIWFLAPPARHCETTVGDYWFPAREREKLASEFQVRSSIQARHERLALLKTWVLGASEVRVLDAAFDWTGVERETIAPLLRKLPGFALEEPTEKGAWPRWLPSYGGARALQPQEISLSIRREADGSPRLHATELDHLSRCAFQWVGLDRWKLRDLEEPDIEIPANIRGTLLHLAVEILVRGRRLDGSFELSPNAALEMAWQRGKVRGLLAGKRLQSYVKASLLKVIEKFCEDESAYAVRSQTKVLSLEEDTELELKLEEGMVRGRPDRIDEHADGLFVIDYKSTTSLPTGKKMLEGAYRLQLAFYALAAAEKFKRPVLGAQFVSLASSGLLRSKGLFFTPWNGKGAGTLTALSTVNTSLFKEVSDPQEIWGRFKSSIQEVLRNYGEGIFRTLPKDPVLECRTCSLVAVCGRLRLIEDDSEGDSARAG